MEEARAGLGGGAEAVLGWGPAWGPAPVSALPGPDPPSERRTAARHRVRPGGSLLTPGCSETFQRLRATASRAVLAQRFWGISPPYKKAS